jgi:HEAT repeat protein
MMLLWVLLLGAAPVQDDEASLRRLIEQMGGDFLEERDAARKSLEKAGAKAEPLLIEGLGSGDFRIRKGCLELLTTLKSAKALARASALFKGDEDPTVRDVAFRLLQSLGAQAEDALIEALGSASLEHRRGAVQTLGEIKSSKCAGPMAALHDRETDKDVKAAAFKCIQGLGAAAEPHLLRYLGSTDAALRKDSLEGLRKSASDKVLAEVGRLYVAETDLGVINSAFEHLRSAGGKAEPHFVEGLKSAQEQTRSRSLEGLKQLKSEGALGAVAEVFLNDSSEGVRAGAAEFLKSQGTRAEASFLRGLEHANLKVRLLSIHSLGEIRSEKPMPEIARLFREDASKEVHRAAFDYLRQLGSKAEKELLHALGDEDKAIRRHAVLALGNARSEAAVEPLVDFLSQLDPDLKQAARDALVRIGPKALEAVDRAAATGKIRRSSADEMLALHYQEEVERLLDRLVTEEGGSGFYEGQFKDLEKFGKERAFPVLRRILREPNYAYRMTERRERVYQYELRMRELAVMALGELGDLGAKDVLKEALKEAPAGTSDSTHEEILVALHRLGEKQALDDFVRKSTADAEAALQGDRKDDGCSLLFSLGLVLNRVGRRDDAAASYQRLVKAVEEHKLTASASNVLPASLYNLACLSALKGEKAPALGWLEKAVKAGFRDRQWIRMDKDLEGLRGDEGYKALLANDKLFEPRGDD